MKKPAKSPKSKSKAASKPRAKSKGRAPAKKASAARKAPAKKTAARKKTAPRTAPAKAVPDSAAQKALAMIAKSLDDDQADNVVVIDLAGKSAMADYLVIASGRNPRHIGAMAQHLREKIKSAAGISPPIEGMTSAEWVLVDQGDVVVHLFRPETRKLYNLEKMWGDDLAPDDADADPRRP